MSSLFELYSLFRNLAERELYVYRIAKINLAFRVHPMSVRRRVIFYTSHKCTTTQRAFNDIRVYSCVYIRFYSIIRSDCTQRVNRACQELPFVSFVGERLFPLETQSSSIQLSSGSPARGIEFSSGWKCCERISRLYICTYGRHVSVYIHVAYPPLTHTLGAPSATRFGMCIPDGQIDNVGPRNWDAGLRRAPNISRQYSIYIYIYTRDLLFHLAHTICQRNSYKSCCR